MYLSGRGPTSNVGLTDDGGLEINQGSRPTLLSMGFLYFLNYMIAPDCKLPKNNYLLTHEFCSLQDKYANTCLEHVIANLCHFRKLPNKILFFYNLQDNHVS